MSTKIYEAYRFPKSRLNEFLVFVREEILSNAVKSIRSVIENAREEYVAEKIAEYKEKFGYDAEDSFRYRYFLVVEPEIEKASKSYLKSFFDLDSSFNIWLNGKYVYVIPYTSIKWNSPNWVSDYSYWDNVDQPENMSDREWRQRGKKWEEICLNHWNETRLQYVIIDYKEHVGQFEIQKRLGLL